MSISPETSMAGRTVVITGGTGGIGFYSSLGLAKLGARVIITGRNAERGEAALKRLKAESGSETIDLVIGDVSSAAAVDALGAAVLAATDRIDVLVNNAGYLGDERKDSVDGIELHFAVNVLAPWRLTLALLPALKTAAVANDSVRVLNITGGDAPAKVDPKNLQAEKGFKGLMTYTHSKSCLEAMSLALASQQPRGPTTKRT